MPSETIHLQRRLKGVKVILVVLAVAAWLSVWGLLERRLYGRSTLGGVDLISPIIDLLSKQF